MIGVDQLLLMRVVGCRQLLTLMSVLSSLFKTSAELRLENLALRINSVCCADLHRSS
jgi:hypothetical protein